MSFEWIQDKTLFYIFTLWKSMLFFLKIYVRELNIIFFSWKKCLCITEESQCKRTLKVQQEGGRACNWIWRRTFFLWSEMLTEWTYGWKRFIVLRLLIPFCLFAAIVTIHATYSVKILSLELQINKITDISYWIIDKHCIDGKGAPIFYNKKEPSFLWGKNFLQVRSC